MKKGIFVALFGLFVSFVNPVFAQETAQELKEHKEFLKENKILEIKTLKENGKCFSADAEYPIFAALGGFNKIIKDFVEKDFSQTTKNFKAECEESTIPWDFSFSLNTATNNEKFVYALFNRYVFAGGAHGYDEPIAFIYDKQKNRQIRALDEIGVEWSDILPLVRADLKKQLEESDFDDEEWLKSGTANEPPFIFDGKNLTLFFPQYVIAPYAFGSFEVVITAEQLGLE